MNTFQKFLLQKDNDYIIKAIIRQFHPSLDIKNLRVLSKYDWICIEAEGISIGVNFHTDFSGPGITLKNFEFALNTGRFTAWRFVDDSSYSLSNPKIHGLLTKLNVPKPTAKEMFNYYYED